MVTIWKSIWLDNYLIPYSKINSKHSKEQKPVQSQESLIDPFFFLLVSLLCPSVSWSFMEHSHLRVIL
ncbi:rCG63024 [Rattus norvegicus]|uniref:RCG63024 n=1 Tax=Rattus norvegicus TaxID=10116 RepID=A6JDN1_RAT|nr:rCG63024 [Rattus norvegicus]